MRRKGINPVLKSWNGRSNQGTWEGEVILEQVHRNSWTMGQVATTTTEIMYTMTLLESLLSCLFYKLSGGIKNVKALTIAALSETIVNRARASVSNARIYHIVTVSTAKIEAMLTSRVCSPVWLRASLRHLLRYGITVLVSAGIVRGGWLLKAGALPAGSGNC